MTTAITTVGPWAFRELALSQEKIDWLWDQIKDMKSLFSDLTIGHRENFLEVLQDPYSFWLEIVDKDEKTVGLMYLTDLQLGVDANIHLLFLDRQPHEKAELCKEMIEYLFNKFPALHRITAVIPFSYHATVRLAYKIGFKKEGVKREAFLLGKRWIDELQFGLLASEVFHNG